MASKEIRDSLPMNGGDGAESYAENSSYQRRLIEDVKGMICQSVTEKLDINLSSNTFHIADFGSSTGPNTFIAVQNIIDAVMLKYKSVLETNITPEFQVFFNDRVDNDFNTLFKNLPPNLPYFAAGVPGSFHNQLFPTSSIYIANSTFAMNWLSKIPQEITDRGSPAWNKGKIYCAGNNKEVTKAYFAQFTTDMDAFLKARARELVEGGLMFIQMFGGADHEAVPPPICQLLNDCLADMVNMGAIREDNLDSLNMPLYFPAAAELKMVIDMNNNFTIEKIYTLSAAPHRHTDIKQDTPGIRAVTENLMRAHFEIEIVDQIYHLLAQNLENNPLEHDMAQQKVVYHFALLNYKASSTVELLCQLKIDKAHADPLTTWE